MRFWRPLVCALCIAVLSLCGGELRAQTTPDNVVVLHVQSDELVVKLSAELKALGYIPVLLKRDSSGVGIDDLIEIVESSGAVALMNTFSSERRVDVWVYDEEESRVFLVEPVDSERGKRNIASIVLKSVELLRARLMKIEKLKTRKKTQPEASHPMQGEEKGIVPTYYRRLSLELGLSLLYGFSRLSPTLQVPICVSLWLGGRLGIDLMGIVPTFEMKVEHDTYGEAGISNSAVALGIRAELLSREHRMIPWFGALVGPQFLRLRGKPNPPYVGEDKLITTSLLLLRFGINVSFVPERLAFLAAIHLGTSAPNLEVGILEKGYLWGRILLSGIIGLKMELY